MRPDTTDDAPLWEALEQSALGRLASMVSTPFMTAARSSHSMSVWRRLQAPWRGSPADVQMPAVGTMMIAAALVHVGLASMRQPAGSWWLIVPGTTLVFGLTAVLLSRLGGAAR